MTDNELLLAISNMIDPLQGEVRELKTDICDLKGDVQELKENIYDLKGDVQELKENICDLKDRVCVLEKSTQKLKNRVRKIEIIQENEILPRMNTIESCYTSTYDRYKDSVEDYEMMRQDISIIKMVVTGHSERLQELVELA